MFFKRTKDKNKEEEKLIENYKKSDIQLTSTNLKSLLSGNEDIVFRETTVNEIKITILYVQGLINEIATSDFILKPLKLDENIKTAKSEKEIIHLIQEGSIYFVSQKTRNTLDDTINDVLSGSTALIFDDEKTAITFHNAGFEKRGMTEPTGENVINGSKDIFVETLRVNTATLRRKIKSPNLRIEQIIVGERTRTPIDIAFMNGIVNTQMLEELKRRLSEISVDGVLTTAHIEEFITDNKYNIFPKIIHTERPDKFCSDILEGRIGLIIDGIPSVFIIPATLLQCLQAPEDYSQNFIISSTIRFMRFALMLTTLMLPAFYTAVTSFHHEMIPSKLASFIESTKEGVPFPTFIEVLFMLIAFEILLEAGLRLPKAIGQTVSIVGAIVVGQAAVEASLVSPSVVVIISLTAISSFAMPNQDFSNALRLWRFIFVISASILGLFGMMVGFVILLIILANTEVLGVPYLSPFVASEYSDLNDSIFRLHMTKLKKRPYNLKTIDKTRR